MADMKEYLRRNNLVAKSIGIQANANAALDRLNNQKRPPKWLINTLQGIIDRSEPLPSDLAKYRDEADPAKRDPER